MSPSCLEQRSEGGQVSTSSGGHWELRREKCRAQGGGRSPLSVTTDYGAEKTQPVEAVALGSGVAMGLGLSGIHTY